MTDTVLPRLHCVTHARVLERPDFPARAAAVLDAGGPAVAVHLRGYGTPGGRIHALATELGEVARATGARLLVNDRVDVALTVPLDGVHLGGGSLPVPVVRRLVGPAAWIGVSIHDASELSARAEGANYAFAGTVHATPSHAGRPGFGPSGLLAMVTAARRLPVIGIGGITVANAAEVMEVGAYGVAVVRGVWGVPDPAAAVRGYLDGLEAAGSVGAGPAEAGSAGAAADRVTDTPHRSAARERQDDKGIDHE